MPKNIKRLGKRRINQLINSEIQAMQQRHNTSLIRSKESPNFVNNKKNSEPEKCTSPTFSISMSTYSNEVVVTSSEDDASNFDQLEEHPPRSTHQNDLGTDLRLWVLQYRASHRSLNDLLKILRRHGCEDLPQDIRSLMKTPNNATQQISKGNGGSFIYFGVENGLKRSITRYFDTCPSEISVQLNCDGLSISRSSTSQLWPLLMAIDVNFNTQPFIVAIFHGYSKPLDANVFLLPLVDEMELLLNNGIIINDTKITIKMSAIICDAPARAFTTCTKYPTGYFSCSKCIQEGEWAGRVVFPELESPLRTDESFKNSEQEEHHNGKSILKRLNIGMVSRIPIDYMHLVCLGIVKRLIQIWCKGPRNTRLSKNKLKTISQVLLEMRSQITVEFARYPRSFETADRWKATEYRQFLLYTGPVILKGILPDLYYYHFLTLSVAIRLLSDPKLCRIMCNYAELLLKWFVGGFKDLYGIEYLCYNVHNLLHLANDVRVFGCLDKYSCFKFENYMSNIKGKIQNAPKPLEQLTNRIMEENSIPVFKEPQKVFPVVHFLKTGSQIASLEFDGFTLTKKKPNNCCVLSDSSIFMIKDFSCNNKVVEIEGVQFTQMKSFSNIPCDLKLLNMCILDETCHSTIMTVAASSVKSKCVYLTHGNITYTTVIPLLQYNN